MPTLTIRNISDETHRALKARAMSSGRSLEVEMRDILEAAVRPIDQIRMGSALFAIGRRAGLSNEDVDALEASLDHTPANPWV